MEKFLQECKQKYYLGEPIISDAQYDALVDAYGEEGVGHTPEKGIPHLFRMYSLQKFYDGEDEPPIVNDTIIQTHKLDGAAISILYDPSGVLIRALTRGDGYKGDDITDKILSMSCVPKTISPSTLPRQIVGEVVASKDIPNSRNYVSGALGLKDIEEFKTRAVTFYAYGSNPMSSTYIADLALLKQDGFQVIDDLPLDRPIAYPTDGVVCRVNSNNIYENMGFTSKHPRGAWAIKTRSEGLETTLLDVIWQVGKSGKVTPVALLEPIEIDGAVVQRATLNNVGFIEALDLSIGDKVLVERAGGIIPRIISKAR